MRLLSVNQQVFVYLTHGGDYLALGGSQRMKQRQPPAQESDLVLVELILSGDAQAAVQFIRRYQPAIYQYAYHQVRRFGG